MSVRVFVEPTGRLIAPFDDPPGEALIGNRRLADRLDEAIANAGMTRIDTLQAPCIVVPDALWCTAGALRKFAAGAVGRDAVLVLGECRFGVEVRANWSRYFIYGEEVIGFVEVIEAKPLLCPWIGAYEVDELRCVEFEIGAQIRCYVRRIVGQDHPIGGDDRHQPVRWCDPSSCGFCQEIHGRGGGTGRIRRGYGGGAYFDGVGCGLHLETASRHGVRSAKQIPLWG